MNTVLQEYTSLLRQLVHDLACRHIAEHTPEPHKWHFLQRRSNHKVTHTSSTLFPKTSYTLKQLQTKIFNMKKLQYSC